MREDAICPACPDPDTAFTIEDVGMKTVSENLDPDAGALHIRVSRPSWEDVMLAHLETTDDDAHKRLYLRCMVALEAEGLTAEEAARRQVQATADMLRDLPTKETR